MRSETEIRELANKLRCNVVGTKGGDAYIISTDETEDLHAWEDELRSKRDAAYKSSERFFFNSFLSTIHFDQSLADWLGEVKVGFKIAGGDYLDYAYVLFYRAGLTGEEASWFMGIKEGRGGHRSVNWKKTRKEILERDNYTCSECGSHEQLEAHHKGWWWDNTPDNLITLCQKCHSKHRI